MGDEVTVGFGVTLKRSKPAPALGFNSFSLRADSPPEADSGLFCHVTKTLGDMKKTVGGVKKIAGGPTKTIFQPKTFFVWPLVHFFI